jgi:leucyl aminopeptidase
MANVAPELSPPPSLEQRPAVTVTSSMPSSAGAVGFPVTVDGPVPSQLGLPRTGLADAGFDGEIGSALVVPQQGSPLAVAIGIGRDDSLDPATLREAAAAFARSAGSHERLAIALDELDGIDFELAAQAVVEGALLGRYRYDALKGEPDGTPVRELTLIAATDETDAVRRGSELGRSFAAAQTLARDLGNTPHSHLNAALLGELAVRLGRERGFEVEVFDKERLGELGCGGLLAVNRGSAEPPRMIKLTYRPEDATNHLAFVGKGVMYDSGGLSLKPSDPVHAQMKNDMLGAAAVLATCSTLRELGCRTQVTAYLMCTDNMPSGTAMALGDVITIRGGKTVEVEDTDAEGRLVMADALVLAAEEQPDAIVDIATLTGSALRALGPWISAVLGNDQGMIDQVNAAAEATGEPVWQLPLHRPYRPRLASLVADLKNVAPIGWPDAIMASLFLSEFVGDVPWAHIDIAGTAYEDADRLWLAAGSTGVGARLLLQLALDFTAPSP